MHAAFSRNHQSEFPRNPPPPERRNHSRQKVDNSAIVILVKIGSRLEGRILDISLGGCRIQCAHRFPVGIYTRVEVEFRIEGIGFRLGGVVQAIHDRQSIGIRFLDTSQRKHEQLAQLIAEIQVLREQEDDVERQKPEE
jgi:hypothetical protein